MNVLLRKLTPIYRSGCVRLFETATNLKNSLQHSEPGKRVVVEPLSDREIVRIQGPEVVPFLQGLITNDMDRLQQQQFPMSGNEGDGPVASMYTMFLNKAGRVLYDSIIYRTPDLQTFLLECDKAVSNELRRHLRLYRVRRKIHICPMDKEFQPWIVFNPDIGSDINLNATHLAPDIYSTPDPRVPDLGMRVLTTPDKTWRDIAPLFKSSNEIIAISPTRELNYRVHRYSFGVGEGVYDLPPGKCFPLEANGDFLNGVSFQKGCYIGQELTARVHHTGIVRKRLLPLRLSNRATDGDLEVKTLAGTNVGVIRGICYNRALALLRVEQTLTSPGLMIDGDRCYVDKPKWWPTELRNKISMREGY